MFTLLSLPYETLGSIVVRNTSVFNPKSIFVTKKKDLYKNVKLLLQNFSKSRFVMLLMLTKPPSSIESFLKIR